MNNENVSKSIGERIRHLRDIKNISQSVLADKLKMSRPVLNRIELGTRSIRDDELINIANFFDVSTDYLLGKKTVNNSSTDLDDLSTVMTFQGEPIPEKYKEIVRDILRSLKENEK